MPLESATTINTLNPLWPLGSDSKGEGDDHLRLIKNVMKNTFDDDGTTLKVKHGVQFVSTDAGAAAGPSLDLYRDSASPAASDLMGIITFNGRDAAAEVTPYARITASIIDPTQGSEDGGLTIDRLVAGTPTAALTIDSAGVKVGQKLVVSGGVDFDTSTFFYARYESGTNARYFGYIDKYYWQFTSGNALNWYDNNIKTFSIEVDGLVKCYNGCAYNTDGSFALSDNGTNRIINFLGASGYYFAVTLASGLMTYNTGGGMRFQVPGATGRFEVSQKAAQPGGGSWLDSSDARIKSVLGTYDSGLEAINALQPVRYTFLGNDTAEPPDDSEIDFDVTGGGEPAVKVAPTVPYRNSTHFDAAVEGTEFIGLVAQEAEGAMPELVSLTSGYIDGEAVTDLRALDQGPLVFALINAVKELTARIVALEGTGS